MNSESDDSLNSQTQLQIQNEMKKKKLENKINEYLEDKRKDLSSVQIKQLTKYRTHLRVVPILKLTETEFTSINNHIDSAIYRPKDDIIAQITEMKKMYEQTFGKQNLGTLAWKFERIRVLDQLKHELDFLPDKYLSKADFDYFSNQLELLSKNKYTLRESLLKIVNRTFSDRKIGTYPYSYIDEVNKLKIKIRRKPFIVSHKTRDKILHRLKKVTNDYKSFLGFKY